METSLKTRSVSDSTLRIKLGKKIRKILKGGTACRSLANILEKYKKLEGIKLDVTKVIFPQNNMREVSLK
jgi:nickel-dependent lactate racemase